VELRFSEFFALRGIGEGIQAIEANMYNKDVFLNTGSCLLHPSCSFSGPAPVELLSVSQGGGKSNEKLQR